MRRACLAAACSLALVTGPLAVQASPIYACVDANGKHISSDRPIAKCISREHRILNPDGSTREIRSPVLTADEQADQDAREGAKAIRAAIEADAVRSDRNLRSRYPDEAAHQRARAAALDDVRRTLQLSQRRLDELASERKPLEEEAGFYAGRPMPQLLKQQLDGNAAATEAQRMLMVNQRAETQRINAAFDAELARLRSVWGAASKPSSPTPKAPGTAAANHGTAASASAKAKP